MKLVIQHHAQNQPPMELECSSLTIQLGENEYFGVKEGELPSFIRITSSERICILPRAANQIDLSNMVILPRSNPDEHQ